MGPPNVKLTGIKKPKAPEEPHNHGDKHPLTRGRKNDKSWEQRELEREAREKAAGRSTGGSNQSKQPDPINDGFNKKNSSDAQAASSSGVRGTEVKRSTYSTSLTSRQKGGSNSQNKSRPASPVRPPDTPIIPSTAGANTVNAGKGKKKATTGAAPVALTNDQKAIAMLRSEKMPLILQSLYVMKVLLQSLFSGRDTLAYNLAHLRLRGGGDADKGTLFNLVSVLTKSTQQLRNYLSENKTVILQLAALDDLDFNVIFSPALVPLLMWSEISNNLAETTKAQVSVDCTKIWAARHGSFMKILSSRGIDAHETTECVKSKMNAFAADIAKFLQYLRTYIHEHLEECTNAEKVFYSWGGLAEGTSLLDLELWSYSILSSIEKANEELKLLAALQVGGWTRGEIASRQEWLRDLSEANKTFQVSVDALLWYYSAADPVQRVCSPRYDLWIAMSKEAIEFCKIGIKRSSASEASRQDAEMKKIINEQKKKREDLLKKLRSQQAELRRTTAETEVKAISEEILNKLKWTKEFLLKCEKASAV